MIIISFRQAGREKAEEAAYSVKLLCGLFFRA